MDEQLDNDLSNRIREVFDNFDEPYPSADEGWLLLRKKFPETEKKRPVAWLWWASAAAALLLFATIGLWEFSKKPQPENMAVKPVKQQPAPTRPTTDTTTLLAAKQAPIINNNPATVTTAPDAGNNNNSKAAASRLAVTPAVPNTNAAQPNINNNIAPSQRQPLNSSQIAAAKTNNADSVNPATAKANTQQYAAATPPPATNQQVTGKAKPDSIKTAIAKTNVQQNVTAPAGSNTAVAGSSSTITQQVAKGPKAPANSMAALFANEKADPQKPKEKYTDDKKVRFGVYAATFFNYAKGSNNQVNAGAGFTSDIKLSKNFKLSTGVALAQNTLSYNGGPPASSNVDALARAPQAFSPYDKESLYSMDAAAFPVLKNYNASLIGLDIPMNIKYEFNPEKSDTYVSAGLSSGTFINEAYTSVYGYSRAASSLTGASQQTTDETTRKNFSGFYFAKTLNVSFGVGYPVGKSNKLIIEPFLKYPLSGLGSQQIQFGAAGLNLKLNFSKK